MTNDPFHLHYDLSRSNSLQLKSVAARYIAINDVAAIPDLMAQVGPSKFIILGSATNTVLPEFYDGIVIKLNNTNITQHSAGPELNKVMVSADSGVIWDDFVVYTLEHNCFGLENLSAIPGTVGASPVQNIGAYGTEVGQYIHSVAVYDNQDKIFKTMSNRDCKFQYRSSIFKNNSRYIILQVNFLLNIKDEPNTQYLDLQKYSGLVSARELRQIVINIRNSKLPALNSLPNVGSFFQNPILSNEQYQALRTIDAEIVAFQVLNGQSVKISAGYLIDKIGLKPFFMNGFSVYHKHALVLVNYNQAGTGTQNGLLALAHYVQQQVLQHYGVQLQIEPNLISNPI